MMRKTLKINNNNNNSSSSGGGNGGNGTGTDIPQSQLHSAVSIPELPDIPLTADDRNILEGLAYNAISAEQALKKADHAFKLFVIQCAQRLGCNSPRYMYHPEKRAFVSNPNFKEDTAGAGVPASAGASVNEQSAGTTGVATADSK